jgi:DNA-damage-inducible protein J
VRNLYIIILEGDNTTATTNINVKVDEELKKDADKLFCDLGLNMSTAITMFLKSAVNNDGIPFEIKRKEPNV